MYAFFIFTAFFITPIYAVYSGQIEKNKSENEKEFQVEERRLILINEALKYLNIRYKYAGADENGFDCSGLIYKSALDSIKLQLPRSVSAIAQFVKKIEDDKALPGDLLFFNTTGKISHIGIYLGEGRFVHSASSGEKTGVIISSLEEKYWKKAYRFAGRIIHKQEDAVFSEDILSEKKTDKIE